MNLEGKPIAQKIQEELKQKIHVLSGRKPGLAFVLVGDNPASKTYVRMKKKACQRVGIVSRVLEIEKNISQEELLKTIQTLNHNPSIDGILIQLPLPSHLNEQMLISAIDPAKDVDGLHPVNFGKLLLGDDSGFTPCTPTGILYMLDYYKIPCSQKHAVIIGRSNIVGKPLAAMLMQRKENRNATVTICHSKTPDLPSFTRQADLLFVAIGKPRFIKKEMIKRGTTIIDIGVNRLSNGTLVGDVDFEDVTDIVHAISPVPGGVGPLTITFLLQNTFKSFQNHEK